MKRLICLLLLVLLPLQAIAVATSIGCAHAAQSIGGWTSVQAHGHESAHRAHAAAPDFAVLDTAVEGDNAEMLLDHCAHCHLVVIGLLVSNASLAARSRATKTFASYQAQLVSTEIDVPERVPLSDSIPVAR